MGGPEYAWLIYGWKVNRRLLSEYLIKNKENNNWVRRFEEYDPYAWFFPCEHVELLIDDFTIYITEEYNDHYMPDEMDAYISIVPKKMKYSLNEIINFPKDLIDCCQKLAIDLGSDESEPRLFSIIEVHQ